MQNIIGSQRPVGRNGYFDCRKFCLVWHPAGLSGDAGQLLWPADQLYRCLYREPCAGNNYLSGLYTGKN